MKSSPDAEAAKAPPPAPELALGYVGVEARDLGAWEKFGRDAIGFAVERGDGMLFFQLDAYRRRFLISEGKRDDVTFIGWEVKSEADLEQLRTRLSAQGVSVENLSAAETAHRGVRKGFRFVGPRGLPFEAYCDPVLAAEPPKLNGLSGFVAGRSGIGHIALVAKPNTRSEFEAMLGARHTDDIFATTRGADLEINFLHFNERHHSIALAHVLGPASKAGTTSEPLADKTLSHVMVEVASLDDVGAANIRCKSMGYKLPMDSGLHPNDNATSFYVTTPSGFELEIAWGSVVITDEASWKPAVYDRTSVWGHAPFGV